MALSASAVYQAQSTATAANVNAGYFNPANANMAADLTTDSNTANTNSPVASSASYNFVAGDVGHWLYIKSGTSWTPGWYQIASVASNKATLSAAVGQAIQVNNNLYGTNTVAGCATVGTPTNGTWTIDYSQSDASPFASTDINTASSTTLTSATNPFGINMVGNGLHVTAGTGFTQGWYEIVSVSGTTATIDRSIGTHPITNATGKVGGAVSLGSSTANQTDDDFFETAVSSSTTSARFFIKQGSYTTGGVISISAAGNAAWPIIIEGYASTRGDRPTGDTRPQIATGANGFLGGGNTEIWCLSNAGTGANLLSAATDPGKVFHCKGVCSSTTAARAGITGSAVYFCEGISYRGNGIKLFGTSSIAYGCWGHDSDAGITRTAVSSVINSIVSSNVTAGIQSTVASTKSGMIINNTVYGTENKRGKGINLLTTEANTAVIGNIIYGCVTGVTHADTQAICFDDYNNYYNNTADVSAATQWKKGIHDTALDPLFTSVQQRTGATATTTSGNHLVQTGATFVTWGVTAGVDYVEIVSGTGVTAGIYGIASVDSETQITTDIALTANATGDKVWSITTGKNFAIGTNLKAKASPGAFPGALTTGYLDIGAVQRQEAGGGALFSRIFTGY